MRWSPAPRSKAINKQNGVAFTTRSGNDGLYRLLALPPGEYSLNVRAPGFEQSLRESIMLRGSGCADRGRQVTRRSRQRDDIGVGQASVLETATASVGQVITSQSISNLPLKYSRSAGADRPDAGVAFGSTFGVAAARMPAQFRQGRLLCGWQPLRRAGDPDRRGPDTIADVNKASIDPPVDSVQELRFRPTIIRRVRTQR